MLAPQMKSDSIKESFEMRRSATIRAGLLALAIALSAAPVAMAQVAGLYYQEVEKDGRIYVFNTPERYKSWSESGEIGTAITLVGRGPNGETVVAENETAADLYFFKHNLPGYDRPTPKPVTPAYNVSWKDGKTTIETKTFKLDLSNRVQIRFTQEMPEVGDDVGSFRIRRAKTKFEGWAYTKNLIVRGRCPSGRPRPAPCLSSGKRRIHPPAGTCWSIPESRSFVSRPGCQPFLLSRRTVLCGRRP